MYRSLVFLLFACPALLLLAQEPAYFEFGQAARFESNPGVYHYVMPCGDPTGTTPQAQGTPAAMIALCWPVRAIHLHMVDGKLQQSGQQILGTLFISAGTVRLTNGDTRDTSSNFTAAARDVQFWHRTDDSFAIFGSGLDAYRIVFLNVCYTCKSGDPEPPPNKASLDIEYGLVQQSLKDFPTAFKRIYDIALKMRIEVTPHNQPMEKQPIPAAAMGLYSAINVKLADSCSEPAKTCVQTYGRYQDCRSTSSTADCGPLPTCSATCFITREAFTAMHVFACMSKGDGMTLTPDWTPYFVEQAKRRSIPPPATIQPPITIPKTIKMIHEESPPPPLPPEDACNAALVFNNASLTNLVGRNAPATAFEKLPNGRLRIPQTVSQGLLISQTPPVYPPIAKAAHITGTVTLHAIIDKDGTVSELEVIGGPPLLQQSAMTAVKTWKFKPYLLDGAPAQVDTTVIVNYFLRAPGNPAP